MRRLNTFIHLDADGKESVDQGGGGGGGRGGEGGAVRNCVNNIPVHSLNSERHCNRSEESTKLRTGTDRFVDLVSGRLKELW